MPLSNIPELENAIERVNLQSSTLVVSTFTTAEIKTLEYIYNWQITIYKDAIERLKGANNIEVIEEEIIN